jgi:hypothetical protein
MTRPRRSKRDKRATQEVSVPFYRELCALQVQYDQMASTVDWKDPARVRSTACGVALAWLQLEAAFIQFIDSTPVELGLGHNAKPQRLVLTSSNYLLRELFRRALNEISNWSISKDDRHILQIILRWLHERLQLWTVVELPILPPRRAQSTKRSKRVQRESE